jgi:hypothetical protein
MRLGFITAIILTCIVATQLVGCTQDQVSGVQNGLNKINDAVVSPLADQKGNDGLSPYVRWFFGNIRTLGYAVIDFIRVASPNAGESPATQPASLRATPPLPAKTVVAQRQ